MSVQPARYRFTVHEYERMGAAGVFHPEDRLELIDGEIVTMAPIGSRHAACVDRLTRLLTSVSGDRLLVRVQNPVRLDTGSEVQPDVSLLRPRENFYSTAHPGPADVLLVVEVSDTTRAFDLGVKARLYAHAGIPTTWVVDVAERCVHVLSDPDAGGYRTTRQATAGEGVFVPHLVDVTLAVADILGAG